MIRPVLVLAVLATTVFGQDRRVAVAGAQYILHVRAADTTRQASMHITMTGGLFGSLGTQMPYPGSVSLGSGGGTATGTLVGSLMAKPGRVTFSSDVSGMELELLVTAASGASTPRLGARGVSVSVVYVDPGILRVETRP